MSSKLNWLVSHTSPGSLVLQKWLTENSVSHSLAQKYATSGWLCKIASGVYYRPSADSLTKPGWIEAMYAIETQLKLPVHLAGLTSLTYQGLNHYVQVANAQVWLGVERKQSLPKWFHEFNGQKWLYCSNSKLTKADSDYKTIEIKNKLITASTPELAAYEIVEAIGKHITFEHVAELFQGLVNLSPRKVQSILARSVSIQTNRVFLFLSHYYQHPWVKRLDESLINLGAGKRQVVKNGYYDERYQITVPHSLPKSEESN
ncbi:type IV toxin-antitoxin system AbiEi family antitoxin [Catenovulum sediminis]|uniref:Type IV toxin-antitoxin system AbiEi family antitoxin n=1 Tax=Catenovulum sediminis TaxID=1740262 RepID=A0ABV1RLD5_9ALTE|nr:type IV toxin-antitoxin system AbiEi family antitoxin [Catenovulum sediminis]